MAQPASARITFVAGLVGLCLAVINHASAASISPSLQRAEVLSGLMAVGLMLVGVLWDRIRPQNPERIKLIGEEGFMLAQQLPAGVANEIAWGSLLLLKATPAASLLIYWQDNILLRRGLLTSEPFGLGPICRRSLERQRAISLVDLKLYPGRAEFDHLLPGLPSVVVQPLANQGVLLVGGWSPRCFSQSDLLWIEGWGQRVSEVLSQKLVEAP